MRAQLVSVQGIVQQAVGYVPGGLPDAGLRIAEDAPGHRVQPIDVLVLQQLPAGGQLLLVHAIRQLPEDPRRLRHQPMEGCHQQCEIGAILTQHLLGGVAGQEAGIGEAHHIDGGQLLLGLQPIQTLHQSRTHLLCLDVLGQHVQLLVLEAGRPALRHRRGIVVVTLLLGPPRGLVGGQRRSCSTNRS